MWELTHFGRTYECTGSIGEALATVPDVQNAVAGQVPFVDGCEANLNTTPGAGANVSFRPRNSGKARK